MAGTGVDIGTAWINVVPSFKGMAKSLGSEIDGATRSMETSMSGALSRAGARAASGIGKALGAVGKIGLGAITAGVAGVAASFAALVPDVIAASDATDKFKQTLGFAGLGEKEIARLQKSTHEYANKTVYDIADIQNTTAQLAANGVPGFDKLAEAAGNLNAVAGGNKDTFRSVGMVLTQTAGAGKLTTENWNQLADAIPGASGKLQEAMKANGAYTGDFRDAMAKGEITAEEFNQAIMDLGLSDAAIEAASSTATFEGAWGNLQASMVDGMTQIVDKFKGPLTGIMSAVADQLGPAFESAADRLEPLAARVEALSKAFEDGSFTIEDAAARVAQAAGGFAALAGGGAALANLDTFTSALAPLDAIPGHLTEAAGKAKSAAKGIPDVLSRMGEDIKIRASYAGDAFGGLGGTIASKMGAIKETVSGRLSGVADSVAAPFQAVGGKISGALSAAGQAVASKMQVITGPLSSLGGKVKAGLAPLGTAFEGLGGAITGPLQGALGQVGGVVSSFFAPGNFLKFLGIGALAAALVAGLGAVVASGGDELLGQISQFAAQLPGMIGEFITQITSQLPQFMSTGTQVILTLIQSITASLPTLLGGAGQIIFTLVTGLAQALPQLIPAAVQMVTTLLTGLVAQLPLLLQAGLQLLVGLVQGIVAALPTLIAAVPQIIISIVSTLVGALPQILTTGIELLTALIEGIVQAIPQLVAMLPTIIDGIVTTLMSSLPAIITAGIQLLVALITGLAQALPQLVAMVPQIILTMVTTLATNFPRLVTAGIQAIAALVRGLVQAIPQVLSTIGRLPGQIVSQLGNLGGLLVNSGKALINGFKNGIMSAASAVKNAVSGILSDIRGLFPFSPAREGPFSGRGWVLYSGLSIGEAMGEGITRSTRQAVSAASGLATATQAALDAAAPTLDVGKTVSAQASLRLNGTGSAPADPAVALAAALSGTPLTLVLDSGERLDAHIETVSAGVLGRRRAVTGRSR